MSIKNLVTSTVRLLRIAILSSILLKCLLCTQKLVSYPTKWKGSNLCGQYLMIVRYVLDPSCTYRDYVCNYDNDVIESWIDKLKTIKDSL